MKRNWTQQVKMGLFVVIGLILVLGTILGLGGGEKLFTSSRTFKAQFDQVQGLATGSIVSIAGITVGNIEKIEFAPGEDKLVVFMMVKKSDAVRVTEGSTVEIRTQGALGDKFVYISPGPISAAPLPDGAFLPAAKASDFLGVLAEKAGDAKKIFEIIDEMNKMMKAFNAGNRVETIMTNFAAASESLKETAKDSRQMMAELKNGNHIPNSAAKLDRILTKIDSGQGTLGALINDSSMHDSLKAMLGGPDRKGQMKNLLRRSIQKDEPSK